PVGALSTGERCGMQPPDCWSPMGRDLPFHGRGYYPPLSDFWQFSPGGGAVSGRMVSQSTPIGRVCAREGAVARGVAASVLASCLFAVMFWYVTLMQPLTGGEIFGWRMLFNAPCITLLLVLNREWGLVRSLFGRMRRRPALVAGVIVCA